VIGTYFNKDDQKTKTRVDNKPCYTERRHKNDVVASQEDREAYLDKLLEKNK
jgi:hypothetical protein